MLSFERWLTAAMPTSRKPVFVAFNAPFDWMFVADYFCRFVGHNPFGHSALDIKALYMGVTGAPWTEASIRYVAPRFLGKYQISHHALQDALDQARIFRRLIALLPSDNNGGTNGQ